MAVHAGSTPRRPFETLFWQIQLEQSWDDQCTWPGHAMVDGMHRTWMLWDYEGDTFGIEPSAAGVGSSMHAFGGAAVGSRVWASVDWLTAHDKTDPTIWDWTRTHRGQRRIRAPDRLPDDTASALVSSAIPEYVHPLSSSSHVGRMAHSIAWHSMAWRLETRPSASKMKDGPLHCMTT